MSTLVQSLKRLYENGRVSEENVRSMEIDGKITFEELLYILGDTVL